MENSDLNFLIKLVKNANLLIKDQFQVMQKDNDGDLVTNFDYEIEKYVINEIKKNYPTFSIISEESNNKNQLTDNCFTIDPLDGTINFVHNIPLWGFQMACIKNKKTCAAVIYLPKLNELYYADEKGAFMNDKPIHVNNLDINQGCYTISGKGRIPLQKNMKNINSHYRDFHCIAVNFAWVANGRLSGTNIQFDNPWDYVPGQFIVQQAGGVIYNDTKNHIAANCKPFLEIIKNNSSDNEI